MSQDSHGNGKHTAIWESITSIPRQIDIRAANPKHSKLECGSSARPPRATVGDIAFPAPSLLCSDTGSQLVVVEVLDMKLYGSCDRE
jgi:hypothetical protein